MTVTTNHNAMPVGEVWLDEAAGPLVRPYAVTGGRTKPDHRDLEMLTVVVAIHADGGENVGAEHARLLEACEHPLAVAEVAARTGFPLTVAKILIGDLIDRDRIAICTEWESALTLDMNLMQKVLDGLRKL